MVAKILSFGLLLAATFSSYSQDAVDIIKKSRDKCRQIRNGYYEVNKFYKGVSGKDTVQSSASCYFKVNNQDSLATSTFHFKQFYEGKLTGEVLYTGNEMVNTFAYDSTALITSKKLWPNEVSRVIGDYMFSSPLTNWERSLMPHEDHFRNQQYKFRYVGEEMLNNNRCYRIMVTWTDNGNEAVKTLRQEQHYWIRKSDLIPLQYSMAIDLAMGSDTMCQYEKYVFTKIELNGLKDDRMLTLQSIPGHYKLKEYTPATYPELLGNETTAPGYALRSLTGEEISLDAFKGKLVLMDFFYKTCYPCMQAMPVLQSLHEKYKGRGLQVIGIDPFDKNDQDLATFLRKRGVTYSILAEAEKIANEYHVSAYPTMYLIGKDGKIILSVEGFSKDMEKNLETIILKNL